MYIPKINRVENQTAIDDFLQKHSFATIIATHGNKLEAVHVPVMISADRKKISFHIAYANPIKNFFDAQPEVLVIFSGPHGYISPRWYTEPAVPTWNYAAIHAYSRIARKLDTQTVFQDLKKLVSRFEDEDFVKNMFEGMDLPLVTQDIPAIIGYELEVTDLQVKFKLSQNRDQPSKDTIIRELKNSPRPSDLELGEFMSVYFSSESTGNGS
jgi:transcriptional regulator